MCQPTFVQPSNWLACLPLHCLNILLCLKKILSSKWRYKLNVNIRKCSVKCSHTDKRFLQRLWATARVWPYDINIYSYYSSKSKISTSKYKKLNKCYMNIFKQYKINICALVLFSAIEGVFETDDLVNNSAAKLPLYSFCIS